MEHPGRQLSDNTYHQYRLCTNVRSYYMAVKQVAKLGGCHSPKVGRRYKSKYFLESTHWDISIDVINFSYWHIKKLKATFYQNNWLFFLSHHFMAHYKSHHFTLIRPYFCLFLLVFVILIVIYVQIFAHM